MSTKVNQLKLTNNGGYVGKMYVRWTDSQGTWQEKDVATLALGMSHVEDLGGLNIPDGAQLGCKVSAVLGSDVKTDPGGLAYDRRKNHVAEFTCSGTTLDPNLGYNGTH